MTSLLQFFHSPQIVAILVTILIFFITIFLSMRYWIKSTTVLFLLVFSLIAGLLANYTQPLSFYFQNPPSPLEETNDEFNKQILGAIENLKIEVNSEKEHLQSAVSQIQEVFDSMKDQSQKLQDLIEEAKDQFKAEYPDNSTSSDQSA